MSHDSCAHFGSPNLESDRPTTKELRCVHADRLNAASLRLMLALLPLDAKPLSTELLLPWVRLARIDGDVLLHSDDMERKWQWRRKVS